MRIWRLSGELTSPLRSPVGEGTKADCHVVPTEVGTPRNDGRSDEVGEENLPVEVCKRETPPSPSPKRGGELKNKKAGQKGLPEKTLPLLPA